MIKIITLKEYTKMRTFVLATVAIMAASTAIAETVISGSIDLDVTENQTTDKYVATPSFNLDFNHNSDAAFGAIELARDSSNDLVIDDWHIGTTVAGSTVSFGDQGGIMPTAIAATSFDSLNDPNAAMKESIQVSTMGVSLAAGFTDISTDVSDVANVQASYTMSLPIVDVTAAVDWNNTTDKYIWGGRAAASVSTVAVGTTMTYAADVLALETDATLMGFTAYLNGNENDWTENAGLAYTTDINGMTLTADANYNFDASEVTPGIELSVKF